MIGDPELKVAKGLGYVAAELAGSSQGRTAADNQTVRMSSSWVRQEDQVDPGVSMTTGRNFDEGFG